MPEEDLCNPAPATLVPQARPLVNLEQLNGRDYARFRSRLAGHLRRKYPRFAASNGHIALEGRDVEDIVSDVIFGVLKEVQAEQATIKTFYGYVYRAGRRAHDAVRRHERRSDIQNLYQRDAVSRYTRKAVLGIVCAVVLFTLGILWPSSFAPGFDRLHTATDVRALASRDASEEQEGHQSRASIEDGAPFHGDHQAPTTETSPLDQADLIGVASPPVPTLLFLQIGGPSLQKASERMILLLAAIAKHLQDALISHEVNKLLERTELPSRGLASTPVEVDPTTQDG